VSLRARDVNNRLVFAFNVSDSRRMVQSRSTHASKVSSTYIASLLSILTQANHISILEQSSWVPVSASTSLLSIKGAISLRPAPSRNVQFISLGIHPLAAESKHNELYDEVNRLFRLSTFGAVEDDVDVNDVEKIRRQSDKRYKADGPTIQSLKARKGVDRYPMFHLRISLPGDPSQGLSEDRLIDGETSFQAVVEVLGAMVTQWLSMHHFCPKRAPQKRDKVGNSSPTQIGSSEDRNPPTPATADAARLPTPKTCKPDTADVLTRKHKITSTNEAKKSSERLQHRAFAEWSRIKSGRADFFTNPSTLPKFELKSSQITAPVDHANSNTDRIPFLLRPVVSAGCDTQMLAQGNMRVHTLQEDARGEELESVATDSNTHDDTMLWTDPATNKTHILNARTGCVVPLARSGLHMNSSSEMPRVPPTRQETSVRLQPKTSAVRKTPWLDNIFKTWDNPVFETSEQQIKKLIFQENDFDVGRRQHRCNHIYKGSEGIVLSTNSSTRLSRESLLGAEVVAQVDKKFILAKVISTDDAIPRQEPPKPLLVLIDQHAADERIQVETLLQNLCSPPTTSCSGYRSKLGHCVQVASDILEKPIQFTISQPEHKHFTTYAARFAFWGVLFDILESITLAEKTNAVSETQHLLSVTALPPSVSERCKADVGHLISFLRSTAWNYASDPHLPSHAPLTPDGTWTNWVRRLASCPEGLVDMINSRACRSAIMFNDELDLDTCRTLVQRLATCKFPFICAHGRPSLVPLVHIEGDGDDSGKDLDTNTSNVTFVEKWKQWVR
jgi:DNA mismatch repair protein MLH3